MTCEIVYASSFEEFFYCDNDIPISEGQPVGVEIENGNEVDFILFDYVYWSLPNG